MLFSTGVPPFRYFVLRSSLSILYYIVVFLSKTGHIVISAKDHAIFLCNKKTLRLSSQSFLFKSATTYFHKPFPANYLRHK